MYRSLYTLLKFPIHFDYSFLWIDNKNLSVLLVEEGLAKVHFSAERTPHFRQLQIAEDNAKARREKVRQLLIVPFNK